MWKKGELVWVYLPDKWVPGRIIDPSAPVGIFVSFFGLMEPRYVPKSCLRSFNRDFGTLSSDSWNSRRFVNRALLAHFWNISFGLWCPCQPPIDSPHLDRENYSLPWFPLNSESALGFVRDMAISQRVTLRRLAETNSSSAQILSFRRYTVDFKRSESVYEEIRASHSEESGWCLDPSDPDVEKSRDLSPRDPLPKDISCSSEQTVDKVVRIHTWNIKSFLTKSGCSVIKACGKTMARTSDHEDDNGHPSKSRERCQVEQSICKLNSEAPIEDIIEEDTTSVGVSEAPPDASNDDVAIGPVEHLQDLGTVENQTSAVDNVISIGVKRKASGDKASARNSKRKKKTGQQSVPTTDNNPRNLHLLKDMRLAQPKCLRMKFLSRHGNLPSKAELLKRFSVFGKIDDSRTDVNLEKCSAKVVFLQSIDAVTAYQFARSKKFTLGRSKVVYRLDPFEQVSKVCPNTSEVKGLQLDSDVNKVPQKSVPTQKPCIKKHELADDREEERRKLKVNFRMETNS